MQKWLSAILLLVPLTVPAAEEETLYLVMFGPGEAWMSDVAFDRQEEFDSHAFYLEDLYEQNVLLMAGETLDEPGTLALIQAGSAGQAQSIADEDPAVVAGVLAAEVTAWRVDLSSMRKLRPVVPEVSDPYKPFRLERKDPGAPINIKD